MASGPLRPSRVARRELIERAATRLFAQRGYAATSVEDVAAAAGISKPMLYRDFESKRDLCVALLERYRDELAAAPLAKFDPAATDWREQIAAMADAWLGWVEDNPDAARLLLAPIRGDADVEHVQRELHARQAQTQTALLRELAPDLDETEAEPLGEALRASHVSVATWRLEHPEVPREVALRALLRVPEALLLSLGAQPGASATVGPGGRRRDTG
jgi:AcrR family transcriptional regulator